MSQPSDAALAAAAKCAEHFDDCATDIVIGEHCEEAWAATIAEAIDKAVAEEREENAALVNRMIGCGRAEIAAAIRARSET